MLVNELMLFPKQKTVICLTPIQVLLKREYLNNRVLFNLKTHVISKRFRFSVIFNNSYNRVDGNYCIEHTYG